MNYTFIMPKRTSLAPERSQIPRLAYKLSETAEMLGLCENTVRRLVDRKLLRPLKATRHLLFADDEIRRFVRDSM